MAVLWASSALADVAVTVYNQNLGLITDHRRFALISGPQFIRLTDVAAQVDPTSVRIRFPSAEVELYEQNYHYDLVNTQAILNRYLDETIRLVTKDGQLYEGTLLSTGSMYVLRTGDEIRLVNPGEVLQVDLARLPAGFFTRPTLEWLVGTNRADSVDAEVSYLTGGMNWHADYVAHLNVDDSRVQLSGWASIDNQSGATYTDAKLKLIAGDIHRAAQPGIYPMARTEETYAKAAVPQAGFEERSFFEYHLYDLPRPTTVADKETKQIALFEPAEAGVDKKYMYRPYKDQAKVAVVVEFENSKANGLGIALPEGRVRITKADRDGTTQLLGEDRIDHTPKDEKLELEVGNAFDLTPEFTVTDRRQITRTVTESDVEIKLRNHKSERVKIQVEQKAYSWTEWEILRSSLPYTKIDADTFGFDIDVPVDGETVLTYTIRTGR
jgi:hypothetical protein